MEKLPLPNEIIRYISLYCTDIVNDRNGVYISRIMKSDERYRIFNNIRYHVLLNNQYIKVHVKSHPMDLIELFDYKYFNTLSKAKLPELLMLIYDNDIIKLIKGLEDFRKNVMRF